MIDRAEVVNNVVRNLDPTRDRPESKDLHPQGGKTRNGIVASNQGSNQDQDRKLKLVNHRNSGKANPGTGENHALIAANPQKSQQNRNNTT